jgi:hypothetical protein
VSSSNNFSTAVVTANLYRGENMELDVPQMPRLSVEIFTHPPEREFKKQKKRKNQDILLPYG